MSYDRVLDSGKRETWDTGSRRDTREGKGRFDLISPLGLLRLAQHYENGAKKYGDHNWSKGQPMSRYLDSLIRHAVKYLGGCRDEDHLSAIAWNALCMIDHEERIQKGILDPKLDDLKTYPQVFLEGDFIEAIERAVNPKCPCNNCVNKRLLLKYIEELEKNGNPDNEKQ